MREATITSTISANDGYSATLRYPDAVAMAFNPLYLEMDITRLSATSRIPTSLEITVTFTEPATSAERSITAQAYSGSARVYLSRTLELFFDDPEADRSKTIDIAVSCESAALQYTFSTLVLWGNLAMGERLGSLGAYCLIDDQTYYYRRVVWFKNFPFKLSLFHLSDPVAIARRRDRQGYSDAEQVTFNHIGIDEIDITDTDARRQLVLSYDWSSSATATAALTGQSYDYVFESAAEATASGVFDDTFDYTFQPLNDTEALVRLLISDEQAGYYLRWIDRQGFMQQYLFTKGESTYKTTADSDSLELSGERRGMWFASHSRTLGIDCTLTHKACATHLPGDIFAYVASVLQATIVDRFLGYDTSGGELWEPVAVASSSVSYDPKEQLHDLEFSFTTPDLNAQRL